MGNLGTLSRGGNSFRLPKKKHLVLRLALRKHDTRVIGRSLSELLLTILIVCVTLVLSWQARQHNGKIATYTTYTTRAGQLASISLRDGSRVTLGPSSTLRVQQPHAVDPTTVVEVMGEALFNVNHGAKHPFLVNAHGVTTRVLGTEFVVRAYDPSLVQVAVREGRVSVQSPAVTAANAAVVTAGEAASVTLKALPNVTPIRDFATEFSWANGELVLRDVPLGEAVVRLSRWYGMDFRVADPALLENRVNGTFSREFDLATIQGLASIVGARVKRSANVLTLTAVQ